MSFRALSLAALAALTFSTSDAEAGVLVVDCAVGPFLSIQAAVTAAAMGDTVAVRPCPTGPYAPFNITNKIRVHVVAAERTTAVGAYSAGVGNNPVAFNPAVVVDGRLAPNVSCVTIVTSGNVEVHNFKLQYCGVQGIDVQGSYGTLLQGNRVSRATNEGILVQPDCENVRIVNNVVSGSGANGILLLDTAYSVIADNQVGLNRLSGILLPTPRDLYTVIVNNEVRLNGSSGIEVWGVETRVERNRLLGNLTSGGGVAELVAGPAALSPDLIGNDTGGGLSVVDMSGTADLFGNR